MTKESIKQFFKPDWRKEAIFGAFLVLGWICFLGILDVSNMTEIFFLLPFAIILEIFSQILESYTFLAGMIFSLIYWYVFSCFLVFLFDFLIADRVEKKSNKNLFYFIFFIIFIIFSVFAFFDPYCCGSRVKARDAKRQSDIRQISAAFDLYYADVDKYPVYSNFIVLRAKGIGEYMKPSGQRFEVPDDPRGGSVYHYIWINNTGAGQDQHFCVYAKLESRSADTWVVGSEKGVSDDATREPTGLGDACW